MSKIKYRDVRNYKYQLVSDYEIYIDIFGYEISFPKKRPYIKMDQFGLLTIREGYQWDGPSGPTIDTKTFMRGSLVHDALYQLMRAGQIPRSERHYADKLLKKICRADGMSAFRAWYVFHGVDKFGASSVEPDKSEYKTYTAP
jgi:hypothetical protein